MHDIIDNRDARLADQINRILGGTEAARFAVGYFFLSGLQAVASSLESVSSLKILIGNSSSRETLEQIAEGCQRLELVAAAEERERYLKRAAQKERAEETAENLRRTIEKMDQTDATQDLVRVLVRMTAEKRLQDLLVHILIRRTRRHILRWYGYAGDSGVALKELSDGKIRPYLSGEKKAYVMVGGRHQYFPKRELETLRYSIEDTYKGLYDQGSSGFRVGISVASLAALVRRTCWDDHLTRCHHRILSSRTPRSVARARSSSNFHVPGLFPEGWRRLTWPADSRAVTCDSGRPSKRARVWRAASVPVSTPCVSRIETGSTVPIRGGAWGV